MTRCRNGRYDRRTELANPLDNPIERCALEPSESRQPRVARLRVERLHELPDNQAMPSPGHRTQPPDPGALTPNLRHVDRHGHFDQQQDRRDATGQRGGSESVIPRE